MQRRRICKVWLRSQCLRPGAGKKCSNNGLQFPLLLYLDETGKPFHIKTINLHTRALLCSQRNALDIFGQVLVLVLLGPLRFLTRSSSMTLRCCVRITACQETAPLSSQSPICTQGLLLWYTSIRLYTTILSFFLYDFIV